MALSFIEDEGDTFPLVQVAIPGAAQPEGKDSIFTQDFRYEFQQSFILESFLDSSFTTGGFVVGSNSSFGLFRSLFSTDIAQRQFFRIEASRL